ncbi:maleylpyruvate isomerase family mycothiol-dependent enzyme [Nocardioides sp. SYSU D00038]|uniref:maleylpyruvate isomerase family mycothiol-dependent enzyme n=1 Tax=Nocardioides sp. SYSU D00038 TaxID=2812554 RepID=UPI0019673C1B|nr:maleylpyruvate isomerase family mycothiol-dependent enzyme [Nocardioides sp. SYSU D00038]
MTPPDQQDGPGSRSPEARPADHRQLLQEATARLVRTVDSMPDDSFAADTILPGWSRAHVVAHVALNSEALAGVLEGVVTRQPTTMYASQERRDADIVALAEAGPRALRDRLLAGATRYAEALDLVGPEHEETTFERTPGGRVIRVGAVPLMRLTEVEVHHADLGAGYAAHDWPTEFVVLLLDRCARRYDASRGFTARATDLDRSWTFGAPGPTVTGPAADLAWWATGRGAGEGLTSDDGLLPGIEAM